MKTKFGNAKISNKGYYIITSGKEGNHNKMLHRLIWEDWYDKPVPEGYVIHHLNHNKVDNRIQNLQCVKERLHRKHHNKEANHPMFNKTHCDESKYRISAANNTTGYFRVSKQKNSKCKQGYTWSYQYFEGGKRRNITSTDLKVLKQKVQDKGLIWKKFDD
ncbi:MAG: HNH endonuclease [Lachnospiraceae bacterium]|nr:HNH endonuclease [Lachnospiraceae bacterium]